MSLAREAAELDRLIHEPARLAVMALLFSAEEADFLYLLRETGLTKGNLSSHLARLEQAGYVGVQKGFVGKIARTVCRLTPEGRAAFAAYRGHLRSLAGAQ